MYNGRLATMVGPKLAKGLRSAQIDCHFVCHFLRQSSVPSGKGSNRPLHHPLMSEHHPHSLLGSDRLQGRPLKCKSSFEFFCDRPPGWSGFLKIWKSDITFENVYQFFIWSNPSQTNSTIFFFIVVANRSNARSTATI